MGEAKRRSKARQDWEAQPKGTRIGDAPVEGEIYEQMGAIMQAVGEFINPLSRRVDAR